MNEIFEIAPGLWEVNFPFSVLGVAMGRRMIMVRLPDGSLQLHSPGCIDPKLKKEIERKGRVSAILGPTNFHDTFMRQALEAFPNASFSASPGFPKVHPSNCAPKTFTECPAEWNEVLLWKQLDGIPSLNETVFLHRPSRTLLDSDLVFNITPEAGAWTRWFFKLNGAYNLLRPTRIFRACIKDRTAFNQSVNHILGWDWDRLVMSHGGVVQNQARERFRLEFFS
jgi:hypothetical protein